MSTAPNNTQPIIQTGLLDRVIFLLKRMEAGANRPRQELIEINAEYSRLISQMNRATFDRLVEYEAQQTEMMITFENDAPPIRLGFNS